MDDTLDRISRSFEGYFRHSLGYLMVVVLGFLLFGFILYTVFSERRRTDRGMRRLFRRLASANGLSLREANLLKRAAEHGQLDNPALIYVRRSLFESAVNAFAPDGGLVESVRRKVYGP